MPIESVNALPPCVVESVLLYPYVEGGWDEGVAWPHGRFERREWPVRPRGVKPERELRDFNGGWIDVHAVDRGCEEIVHWLGRRPHVAKRFGVPPRRL